MEVPLPPPLPLHRQNSNLSRNSDHSSLSFHSFRNNNNNGYGSTRNSINFTKNNVQACSQNCGQINALNNGHVGYVTVQKNGLNNQRNGLINSLNSLQNNGPISSQYNGQHNLQNGQNNTHYNGANNSQNYNQYNLNNGQNCGQFSGANNGQNCGQFSGANNGQFSGANGQINGANNGQNFGPFSLNNGANNSQISGQFSGANGLNSGQFGGQYSGQYGGQNSGQNSVSMHSSTPTAGFRLIEDTFETASIYSVYKQKIDKMFSDNDSLNNTVQAKIERMFNEVAYEEGIHPKIGESGHVFSVDYLGSIPLSDKVTSLSGLQIPLKELYFGYKKSFKNKGTLTGKLEISSAGLKVKSRGDKGDLEQLNPFPTIAVWSSVKFVLHKNNNTSKITFAFIPLITDPDNIDKQSLFQTLTQEEIKYMLNQNHAPLFTVVMRKIGLHKQLECHAFICQTSEDSIVIAATLYKSLMAHMKHKSNKLKNKNGISCMSVSSSTFADSISNVVPVRPPRKKRSTTSSIVSDTSFNNSSKAVKKSTKTRKAPGVPLPSTHKLEDDNVISRGSNGSASNYRASNGSSNNKKVSNDMDQILPYETPNCSDDNAVPPTENNKKTTNENSENHELKRSRSVRKSSEDNMASKMSEASGDILTKVTIPRSGSFLNTGGLTRYKSKVNRTNGLTSGGSPLGFSELFAEFRLQENLHSLDEILGAIVKPEGMSFNNLKPIYKEFLLKLAVTLTKDELYQRAKVIMRRKKRRERKPKAVGIGVQKLKRVFRKSFRLSLTRKLRKQKLKNMKATSKGLKSTLPASDSTISTSTYDTGTFKPKEQIVQRKQSHRKKNYEAGEESGRLRRDRMSTSEDSDFFTMKRRKNKCSPNNQNRNSSSGYVSCSECSYDSDTCTCVSADKCYCSLGNRFSNQNKAQTKLSKLQKISRPQTVLSTCKSCRTVDDRCYCSLDPALQTLTWCGCETDTCTESEKCYCQGGKASRVLEEIATKNGNKKLKQKSMSKKGSKFDPKSRIFEELQRKGFFPTNEDQINFNPNIKPSKNKKHIPKPRHKPCTEKHCYCADNLCGKPNFPHDKKHLNNLVPNKSYLHSKIGKKTENPFCNECENCNSGTIFEQLQKRGFIPSYEEMTTPPNERKLCKKYSNTGSTKSMEYLHNPSEKYYERLRNRQCDNFEGMVSSQKFENFRRRSASENNLQEFDLMKQEVYGRAMSEVTPRNGLHNSVRSFKSVAENTRRSSTGKTLQKSIPPSSSTEALSVKKSAEIAALFTDLKLSQTTDITHMIPTQFHANSSNTHNSHQFPQSSMNSQVRPRQFHTSSSDKKAIVTPYKHISRDKMVQNSLYQGRIQNGGKNGLYSARNGLYTIQSQSDSSCSENRKVEKKSSNSLENTLGYLP